MKSYSDRVVLTNLSRFRNKMTLVFRS